MSTISSMARNNYLMLRYAQNTGQSLFNTGKSANKTFSLWSDGSSMLGGYGLLGSISSSSMSGLMGLRSGMTELVKSYDSTAKAFKTEFSDTMSDLSKASADIKKINFDVGGKSALTQTTSEDGTVTTTKSSELVDALKGIEDFASKYNDAIGFFKDNADLSKYMKNIANTFSDTTYRAKQFSGIGIVVGNDGKMKIDEDVLTKALTENPSKVGRLLGKDGLAGMADRHISFAKSQQNRLFPSISSALGINGKSSSLYSSNSLMRMSGYSSLGNLFNSWI